MKEKRVVVLIFFLTVMSYLLCACESQSGTPEITIDYEKSYFLDFSVEGERVIIRCHYSIINHSNTNRSIQLQGDFQDDCDLGLVREGKLYARIDLEAESEIVVLLPGNNEVDVLFVGTYGGNNIKNNRLLPKTAVLGT